jgi:tetratricopeptide (TPR) repeat protein
VLAEALETYKKPVQISVTDGGTPGEQFRSSQERCESVLSSLDRLDKEYEGSDPARSGVLVRAGCLLESGRAEEAVQAYREYLAASSSKDPYRFLVYEGLGYALESQGKFTEALAEFRLMAPEGSPLRDRAMWHEARLLERQGKKKEAGALYDQILEKFPTTQLRDQIVTRSGALGE